MAAAQLRAPLFEDKVVDFLFGTAEISEREVTREALQAAVEAEDTHVHGPGCGHDHGHGAEEGREEGGRQEGAPAEGRGSAEKPAKKAASAAKKPAAKKAKSLAGG